MGLSGKKFSVAAYADHDLEHMKNNWPIYNELQGEELYTRQDIAEKLYGLLLKYAPRSRKDPRRSSISLGSKKPMSDVYICNIARTPGGVENIVLHFTDTESLLIAVGIGLGYQGWDKKKKAYAWLETMAHHLGLASDPQRRTYEPPAINTFAIVLATSSRSHKASLNKRGSFVPVLHQSAPMKKLGGGINLSSHKPVDIHFNLLADRDDIHMNISFHFDVMYGLKSALSIALTGEDAVHIAKKYLSPYLDAL